MTSSSTSDSELLDALKAKLLQVAEGTLDGPPLPRQYDGTDLDIIAYLADTAFEEIAFLQAEQQRARAEAVRNAQRLEESLAALREVQRHARIGTWEWDMSTGEALWSDEHYGILGLDPATPAGLPTLLALVHPEDRERVGVPPPDLDTSSLPPPLAYRIVTPAGELRHVYCEPTRRRVEPDGRVFLSGILQDVTARVSRDQQLEASRARLVQAEKMEAIGRLAGGVAHDFNNLLTVIDVHAEFLRHALEAGAPDPADVTAILNAADRAAVLTGQLLAFGRRQLLAPEPTDVWETLRGLTDMLQRLLAEDIVIELRGTEEDTVVRVAPGQLEQVAMNLALNARDAMPAGGRLLVSCDVVAVDDAAAASLDCAPGEYVEILVEDTGEGVDEETLARVFEPFFSTKEERGTGLGLATVYGIVHQAGGHIVATSRLGHGTRFRVLLPRVDEEAAVAAPRASLPPLDGPPARVLLVEDEDGVRLAASRVLRIAGFEVVEACDGAEALAVGDVDVDVVLTDVVMPGMNGVELAARLRARTPSLRVLFMSGYTDDQTLRYGLERGETDLLTKPFTPEQLVRRLREVIRRPA